MDIQTNKILTSHLKLKTKFNSKIETNKYPYILFFRFNKYNQIDNFLHVNKDKLNCSIYFIDNFKELNLLFNSSYQLLITFGPEEKEYVGLVNSVIADRMRKRWIHVNEITSIDQFNYSVNYCFINICLDSRINVRPVFSLFTSTYNSYEKIIRCYNSLKKQKLLDWEWVIVEDSPDDNHFFFLRDLLMNDNRVRLYKRTENSGNIGNVKNEAVSLTRGKYVLELDHDDELVETCLSDSATYFDKHPEVGFIYMDFINIYEDGSNFWYCDFISAGYGGYYSQKYKGKWVYIYMTPNINNITLSHLTNCPNHPRIWRKDILIESGNYSEFLPICDDYEILLRTALNTKMARIHKIGYIQYMNKSNNNFSLIRNSEINRIGPHFISTIFYDKLQIHEKMKLLDAYEDPKYMYEHKQLWLREDDFEHKYCNYLVNVDYKRQFCFIGLDSLIKNIDLIRELYKDETNDFIVLDNKCTHNYLWWKLDYYQLDRFRGYSLQDYTDKQLEKYFLFMYKSCDEYHIFNNNVSKIKYNTEFGERLYVIHSQTRPQDKYVEIGVETGITFLNSHFIDKEGVDPDPKCEHPNLIKKTSDDYFAALPTNCKKDVFFIDGMHQVEYVLNDVNNSINHLNEKGKIFLDDILPLTYDEQCKIPKKHFYENGILKYGESWTGDVWKIVYHLLINYRENFDFSYFYHVNYRGVGCFQIKKSFQIPEKDIEVINNYEYFTDYSKYIELLSTF